MLLCTAIILIVKLSFTKVRMSCNNQVCMNVDIHLLNTECYAISKRPGPDDTWLCDRCQAIKANPAEIVVSIGL
jgi:hypothetical protein